MPHLHTCAHCAVLHFSKHIIARAHRSSSWAHFHLPRRSWPNPLIRHVVCKSPQTSQRCFSLWGSAAASWLQLAPAVWSQGGRRAVGGVGQPLHLCRVHAGHLDSPTFLPEKMNHRSFIWITPTNECKIEQLRWAKSSTLIYSNTINTINIVHVIKHWLYLEMITLSAFSDNCISLHTPSFHSRLASSCSFEDSQPTG